MGDHPPPPGSGGDKPPDISACENEPPTSFTPISASIANLLTVHKIRMESQPGPSALDSSLEQSNIAPSPNVSGSFGTENVVFVGDEVDGVLSSSPSPSSADLSLAASMDVTEQGHGDWQTVQSPRLRQKRKNLSGSGSFLDPECGASNTHKKPMMNHSPDAVKVSAPIVNSGQSDAISASDPVAVPSPSSDQSEMGRVIIIEPTGPEQERKQFIGKSIQVSTLLQKSLFGQSGFGDIKVNFKKNYIVITMNSDNDMGNLLSITKLGPYSIKCHQPESHTACFGVIHPIGLETTIEEIQEALSVWGSQANIVAERISRRQGGETIQTRNIRLKFQSLERPNHVYLAQQRFVVHPYVGKVMQCYNCQGFDHVAKFCRVKRPKCMVCSGPHKLADCPRERVLCSNCSGSHTAGYGGCPKMKIATKVSKIIAKGHLTRKEAVVLANKRSVAHAGAPPALPGLSRTGKSAWNSVPDQIQQIPNLERDFPPLRTAEQIRANPGIMEESTPISVGISVACQTVREVACQTDGDWLPTPLVLPQPDAGNSVTLAHPGSQQPRNPTESSAPATESQQPQNQSENSAPATESFAPDAKFLGCLMEIVAILMKGDALKGGPKQTGMTAIAKVIKKCYGVNLPPVTHTEVPGSRSGTARATPSSATTGGNSKSKSTNSTKNGGR